MLSVNALARPLVERAVADDDAGRVDADAARESFEEGRVLPQLLRVVVVVDGRFQLFGGNGLWRRRLLHALRIDDGRSTHQNEETDDQQRVSAP